MKWWYLFFILPLAIGFFCVYSIVNFFKDDSGSDTVVSDHLDLEKTPELLTNDNVIRLHPNKEEFSQITNQDVNTLAPVRFCGTGNTLFSEFFTFSRADDYYIQETDHGFFLYDLLDYDNSILVQFKEAGNIGDVAISPDGKIFAISLEHMVYLWTKEGEIIGHFFGEDKIFGLAFSQDGKQLASGSNTGRIHVWNIETGEEVHAFRMLNDRSVSRLFFSPDNQKLVSYNIFTEETNAGDAINMAELQIWSLDQNETLWTYETPFFIIDSFFSNDGETLNIYLIDPAYSPIEEIIHKKVNVNNLSEDIENGYQLIIPATNLLGSTEVLRTSGEIFYSHHFYDSDKESGQTLLTSYNPTSDLYNQVIVIPGMFDSMSISSGETYFIFTDFESGRTIMLNRLSGEIVSDRLNPMIWSGSEIHFSGDGKNIRKNDLIWELQQCGYPNEMNLAAITLSDTLNIKAISTDGRFSYVSGDSNYILNNFENRIQSTLSIDNENSVSAIFSDDGHFLIITRNNEITLYDVSSGRQVFYSADHKAQSDYGSDLSITDIALSSTNRYMASASEDATIKIWDISEQKFLTTLDKLGEIDQLFFSPDEKLLYFERSNDLLAYSIPEGTLAAAITNENFGSYHPFAVSPNGLFAVKVTDEGFVIISIPDGRVTKTIENAPGITSVGISNDSSLIATSTGSGIILWGIPNS